MSKWEKAEKTKIERRKVGVLTSRANKVVRPPRGMAAPDFNAYYMPEPGISTRGLPDTGDPEENVEQEIGAVLAAILREKEERRAIFALQIDVNYFFSVVFQSVEQKEEFLKAVGWDDLGMHHLDGLEVARRMGVSIAPIMLPKMTPVKAPKKLRNHDVIEVHESTGKEGENA